MLLQGVIGFWGCILIPHGVWFRESFDDMWYKIHSQPESDYLGGCLIPGVIGLLETARFWYASKNTPRRCHLNGVKWLLRWFFYTGSEPVPVSVIHQLYQYYRYYWSPIWEIPVIFECGDWVVCRGEGCTRTELRRGYKGYIHRIRKNRSPGPYLETNSIHQTTVLYLIYFRNWSSTPSRKIKDVSERLQCIVDHNWALQTAFVATFLSIKSNQPPSCDPLQRSLSLAGGGARQHSHQAQRLECLFHGQRGAHARLEVPQNILPEEEDPFARRRNVLVVENMVPPHEKASSLRHFLPLHDHGVELSLGLQVRVAHAFCDVPVDIIPQRHEEVEQLFACRK